MIKAEYITLAGDLNYKNITVHECHCIAETDRFFSYTVAWKCADGSFVGDADDISIIKLNNNTIVPRQALGNKYAKLISHGLVYADVQIINNYTELRYPNVIGPKQIVFICQEGTFIASKSRITMMQIGN